MSSRSYDSSSGSRRRRSSTGIDTGRTRFATEEEDADEAAGRRGGGEGVSARTEGVCTDDDDDDVEAEVSGGERGDAVDASVASICFLEGLQLEAGRGIREARDKSTEEEDERFCGFFCCWVRIAFSRSMPWTASLAS